MNYEKLQPYKILIGLIVIALIVYFGVQLSATPRHLGGVGADPTYGTGGTTVTNTTAICPPVIATIIVATGTGRTSFAVALPANATNTVTLCKAGTCTANTSGYNLSNLTSTNFLATYEQLDSYAGTWSCVAGASTTIGVSYSQ